MYNKLKNIIPHRIKIDNFCAELLDKSNIQIVQKLFEKVDNHYLNRSSDGKEYWI